MSLEWVKHLPPGQHDRAGYELEHRGCGERNGIAAGQVVQHTESERSEREYRLIDRRYQRDDSRNVGRLELRLGDNRRQQYEIADAESEESAADQQCRHARCQGEEGHAAGLHCEISRRRQTAVGAPQQAPEQKAPRNRAERSRADRRCCSRGPQDRGEALDEMRNEPDLREEPERETR